MSKSVKVLHYSCVVCRHVEWYWSDYLPFAANRPVSKFKCSRCANRRYAENRKKAMDNAQHLGTHTETQWNDLKKSYGNVCLKCGAAGTLTLDHIIPISKGGSDGIDNIQPLCWTCNNSKKQSVVDYRPDKSCVVDFTEWVLEQRKETELPELITSRSYAVERLQSLQKKLQSEIECIKRIDAQIAELSNPKH